MEDFRRNVDPEMRRKTNKSLLELKEFQSEYNACKNELDKCDKKLQSENAKLASAAAAVEESRNVLSNIQEEIDCDYLPEGAQPRARIQRRDEIALQVDQLETALEVQRDFTYQANEEYLQAERHLFIADKNLNRFAETLDDVILAKETIAALDEEKAKRLTKIEVRAKENKEKSLQAIKEAKEAQMKEMKLIEEQNQETIKILNNNAKKKLMKTELINKEIKNNIKNNNEKHLEERFHAVTSLKNNLNIINNELTTLAESNRQKITLSKQKFEDQKEYYLSKGLNPYIEFRKEELLNNKIKTEKKIKNSIELNKINLSNRIEKETKFIKNQEKKELLLKEYELSHRASQGRTVIEEKNHQYILSQTQGTMEVLDPLGKEPRVYPSQILNSVTSNTTSNSSNLTGIKKITANIRETMGITKQHNSESDLNNKNNNTATSIDHNNTTTTTAQPILHTKSSSFGITKTNNSIAAALAAMDDQMDNDSSVGGGIQLNTTGNKISDHELKLLEKLTIQSKDTSSATSIPGLNQTAIDINLNGNILEKKELIQLSIENEGDLGNDTQVFHQNNSKYKIAMMSKFEIDALERAKERQYNRIEEGIEQIAGGKIFSGPSFISKPSEIIFQDFIINKKYKKKFLFTNVSYTFNSFKYVNIENEDYIDFFTITYDKPGRISAGMNCTINIEFIPKINNDIYTNIIFYTETGPVKVPIKCLIQRCAPRVVDTEVHFGSIIMGEKKSMSVRINNSQALSTRFSIIPIYPEKEEREEGVGENSQRNTTAGTSSSSSSGSEKQNTSNKIDNTTTTAADVDIVNDENNEENNPINCQETALNIAELNTRVYRITTNIIKKKKKESPHPIYCHINESIINGYSNTSIEFHCAPLEIGNIVQKYKIIFEDVDEIMNTVNDHNEIVKKEQIITIHTICEKLPIYIDNNILDLKCTLLNRIYRNKIIIKNRGKTAYKVMIKLPTYYTEFIDINPNMFFIQANSSQSVHIKFIPTMNIYKQLNYFLYSMENYDHTSMLSMPIELQVVNQEIPVYFLVNTTITSSNLTFSSMNLYYNKVYIGQKSSQIIKIKNNSILPQKIAFIKIKKEFLIKPNDGFGLLLPNETQEYEISFTPYSSIQYNLNLTILTSFNDTYIINVFGEGILSPITLSSNVIQFHTTYPGQRVRENIIVKNTTKTSQCLQVMLPDKIYSWLTISPTVLELPSGESGRLEVEYLPPSNTRELDPIDWHRSLTEQPDAPPSPFDTWDPDSGWVFGRGVYGQVQWVKPGARAIDDAATTTEEVEQGERGEADPTATATEMDESSTMEGSEADSPVSSNLLSQDLPAEEWGVYSSWSLPILLKPRKRSSLEDDPISTTTAMLGATGMNNTTTTTTALSNTITAGTTGISPLKTGVLNKTGLGYPEKSMPSPLFLSIECAVTLPQLDSDIKVLDFGQVSVGTRLVKSVKLFNRSAEPVKLHSIGLNAVGPFTLIRPIKEIGAGEALNLLIECLPARPGLNVEVLEISAADPEHGGHHVTLTFKVQGLMPVVELSGLSPPPPNWSSRCGILDFGHILKNDYVVKTFTLKNRSSFAINASIIRVPSNQLNSKEQSEMIERTITGLPVFSIRPYSIMIPEGGSEEIEVTFHPDCGRFLPYREDIDIVVGETDEILRVGILGRAWERQLIVIPEDPRDEPFSKLLYQKIASVDDYIMNSTVSTVRTLANETRTSLNLQFPESPVIVLEYPDPFSTNALPSSYIEIGSNSNAVDGNKGKSTKNNTASIATVSIGARQQVKRLLISTAIVNDNRPGTGPGTFDIILSPEAVASGLFQLNIEKGNIVIGTDITIDITCTVPKPRSLGGIFVGSWKLFDGEVVLKGGWRGDGVSEENRVPFTLKAYVCL